MHPFIIQGEVVFARSPAAGSFLDGQDSRFLQPGDCPLDRVRVTPFLLGNGAQARVALLGCSVVMVGDDQAD